MTIANRSGSSLVRALILEGFSKNDPDVLRDVLAEDFILTSAGAIAEDGSEKNGTRDTLLHGMAHNHRSFSDWSFTIDHLTEADAFVTARWTARGVHTGSFSGEMPTNEEVILKGLSLYCISKGNIVQDWVFADQVGFARQLGLGAQPEAGAGERLVRQFWENVINAHDPEAADAIMAADYKQNADGIAPGPGGFKEFFRDVLSGSSGMSATIESIIDTGGIVVSTTTISFSTPPEGWAETQTIVDVFRTNGQKLTEHWDLRV